MIGDYFKFSFEGIKKRRLRSSLTMIGIFIGIAAVVSLISLGQGLQSAIEDQFNTLGGDKLIISPGAEGGVFGSLTSSILTNKDLETVSKASGVDKATEMFYSTGRVKFGDQTKTTFVIGLPTDESASIITDLQGFTAEKGRDLKEGDSAKVTVGWRLWSDDFFDKPVKLRDKLEIEGEKFEVVGLIKKIGNPQDDAQVYIQIDKAKEMFNKTDEVAFIFVQVEAGENPETVAENIKKDLRRLKNEKAGEESFQVQTFGNIMDTFNTVFGIVQAVIIGIAAISLLVGGIGIMNTMYMSVMERTKEIGVMKAIGARNSHILTIFLIESGIYGFFGGAIGIMIGAGIAKSTEFVAQKLLGTALLRAELGFGLIGGALAFSFLIGAISGLAPAYRASQMNPVRALRYE